MEFPEVEIIDPKSDEEKERRQDYGLKFFEKRMRKGVTEFEAFKSCANVITFGAMMVEIG